MSSVVRDPVVELKGAVAVLGPFPALAGVDLDVRRGEIVLLRGPNGAGKTTLLRVCAGLIPVERGEARVLGHDLRTERELVRSQGGLDGGWQASPPHRRRSWRVVGSCSYSASGSARPFAFASAALAAHAPRTSSLCGRIGQ